MTASPSFVALSTTGLWQDVLGIPEAMEATLARAEGFDEVAAILAGRRVRRVVATGNGAAYYVAHALWLASLQVRHQAPDLVAVPAGLLERGSFTWRDDDMLLAISSSGEFRDVLRVSEQRRRQGYVALTAASGSTLAHSAMATASYVVENQRAVTHTQVFCGSVLAALAIWARVTRDVSLLKTVAAAPAAVQSAITLVTAWVEELTSRPLTRPAFASVFGSGLGWSAALEAALLLKEVAGIPAEGAETREGATSSMYPLQPGHLAVSIPVAPGDAQVAEAEAICGMSGATVLRVPIVSTADERLAPLVAFPPSASLAVLLACQAGLNVDQPPWTTAYYATARADGKGPGAYRSRAGPERNQ